MKRVRTHNTVQLVAALLAAMALLLWTIPMTAEADENPGQLESGYVMVGDVKVAKALGITTEAELYEFMTSGIPSTVGFDPQTGDYVIVDPGSEETGVTAEEAKMMWDGTMPKTELHYADSISATALRIYQNTGAIVLLNRAGENTGYWEGVTKFSTGSWTANMVYIFRGVTAQTSTCYAGTTCYPVYGNTVTAIKIYMV